MRLEWMPEWPEMELYTAGEFELGGVYGPDGHCGVSCGAKCFLTDRAGDFATMAEARAFVEAEVKRWAAEYLAAVACRPGSSDGSDKSDKSDGSDKAAEALV